LLLLGSTMLWPHVVLQAVAFSALSFLSPTNPQLVTQGLLTYSEVLHPVMQAKIIQNDVFPPVRKHPKSPGTPDSVHSEHYGQHCS